MSEHLADSNASGVLDAIGELAKARRERVIEAIPASRPAWLESIEAGEIAYYLRIPALPINQIDPQLFIEALRDAYGLVLGKLDLSPLLARMTREELGGLAERDILDQIVRTPRGQLKLTNGRFSQRNDFYAINFVRLSFEAVMVQVSGPTVIAETVARDVAEMVWAAVGVTKQWPAIEPDLMLIRYGTSTRIDLPGGSHRLLNPALWKFLQDNLDQSSVFATDLAGVPQVPGRPPSRVVAVPSFDSLEVRIGILNMATGHDTSASLKFQVTARSDHGSGRVLVTSQLPYEQHIELLGQLLAGLGEP
jgi:hypothetical protein